MIFCKSLILGWLQGLGKQTPPDKRAATLGKQLPSKLLLLANSVGVIARLATRSKPALPVVQLAAAPCKVRP